MQTMLEGASRLAPYGASPSSDPGVQLSCTGLLAKLMHHTLYVYTDGRFSALQADILLALH